jgi:hypothetical protein
MQTNAQEPVAGWELGVICSAGIHSEQLPEPCRWQARVSLKQGRAGRLVAAFLLWAFRVSLSPCFPPTGLLDAGPPYPPCPLSNAGFFIRSMVRHP